MIEPVKLYIRTEPHKGEDEEGLSFDGIKIIGDVKRGEEVLYTKEVITDDTIESVCQFKDMVALEIELWAVQNTDFVPEPEHMPC